MRPDLDQLSAEDRAARTAAEQEFARPLVLEAGAGTGKTTTLLRRLLVWLLQHGWERHSDREDDEQRAEAVISRAVAITFTEKAAAELAEGIAHGLRELKSGQLSPRFEDLPLALADGERARRAALLIGALHLFHGETIHGFCRRLLARWPLHAGLPPGFEVDADESALRDAIDALLIERLPELYGDPLDPEIAELSVRDFGPDDLRSALLSLMREQPPREAIDAERAGDAGIAALSQSLAATLRQLESALTSLASAGGKLGKALAALDWSRTEATRLAAIGDVAGLAQFQAEEPTLPSAIEEWSRGRFSATEEEALGPAQQQVRALCQELRGRWRPFIKLEPARFAAAARLLHRLWGELSERLQDAGSVNFAQLIVKADRLFCEHPALAAQAASEIDQLLVDEFQDTDPAQCRLIAALTLEAPESARPSLFLVGDPKQSIYSWRTADLAAYELFMNRVIVAGGARYRLSKTRRNSEAILAEVDRIAAPTLLAEPEIQPSYQPLVAEESDEHREWRPGPRQAAIEYWYTGSGRKSSRREREAKALADDLLATRASGSLCEWRRAAVLLRSSSQQETYLQELKRVGIPFVVEGDRSFFRRRETLDAISLLHAVFDPSDQIALVATLRSSIAGVPDAAWPRLWRADFPSMLNDFGASPEAIQALLDKVAREIEAQGDADSSGLTRIAGWELAAGAAIRSLLELRRAARELPADRFLELLRDRWLFEETEGARWLGAHRVANLQQLFERFLGSWQAHEGSAGLALRELERAARETREEREAPLTDDSLDAVQVLTVHKAKGLTFDQVYLIDLDHASGPRSIDPNETRVLRHGERVALTLLGTPDPEWGALKELRDRVERAEAVRTLYVAITRPRHRLVLSGLAAEKGGDDRSLGALLSKRTGGLRAASGIDDAGVLWRNLEAEDVPEQPRLERVAASRLAPEKVEAAQRRLAAARVAALERMQSPLIAGASRAAHDLEEEEERWRPLGESSREQALAIGTAFHRAIESLDLTSGDLRAAWSRAAEAAVMSLDEGARRAAAALFERFGAGPLMTRLEAIAASILARELPFVGAAGSGALWGSVGAIDMLYRNERGELVVVDFKTEQVGKDQLAQRAESHRHQLESYRRALAPSSAMPVGAEIWFVEPGEIVTL